MFFLVIKYLFILITNFIVINENMSNVINFKPIKEILVIITDKLDFKTVVDFIVNYLITLLSAIIILVIMLFFIHVINFIIIVNENMSDVMGLKFDLEILVIIINDLFQVIMLFFNLIIDFIIIDENMFDVINLTFIKVVIVIKNEDFKITIAIVITFIVIIHTIVNIAIIAILTIIFL